MTENCAFRFFQSIQQPTCLYDWRTGAIHFSAHALEDIEKDWKVLKAISSRTFLLGCAIDGFRQRCTQDFGFFGLSESQTNERKRRHFLCKKKMLVQTKLKSKKRSSARRKTLANWNNFQPFPKWRLKNRSLTLSSIKTLHNQGNRPLWVRLRFPQFLGVNRKILTSIGRDNSCMRRNNANHLRIIKLHSLKCTCKLVSLQAFSTGKLG